jgi:D-3-phosphoglycerate dehydrogenase
MAATILVTDYPWPDLDVEREIATQAGFGLVAGPAVAGTSSEIEKLVAEHNPAAIMTCWAQVSAAAVALPSELKVVARLGVGLDNIALEAASARNAWVTNVPDYCVEEVSDHAIALVLDHFRGVTKFDREAKLGNWNPASARLRRVRTLTVGIVGFGRIGKATARKLSQGFGVRVLAYSPSLLRDYSDGAELSDYVFAADLHVIQQQSDAIVLHLPLTGSNKHFIDDAFVRACARKPLLVNVSRGGLVDNAALLRALDSGALAGAALDVVDGEPAPPAEVVGRNDVIVTPHVAFSSDASLLELRRRCTEDVVRVLKGLAPIHACNRPHSQLATLQLG